jgi:hypothetical protein
VPARQPSPGSLKRRYQIPTWLACQGFDLRDAATTVRTPEKPIRKNRLFDFAGYQPLQRGSPAHSMM